MITTGNTRRTACRELAVMITGVLVVAALGVMTPAGAAIPTAQWQVPAPALAPYHRTPPPDWPTCHVAEIHASARTVNSTYAVLGVVRLHAHHCVLDVANRVDALLDAANHPLKLTIRDAARIDRGVNPPYRANAESWGFAWRGSWCGAQAVYVRITLAGGHRMRIPLPGAQPTCTKPGGKAVVLRGSFGSVNQPVQTAPKEWAALHAKVHVDPSLPGSTLRGLAVTLTNSSSDLVNLDPCPDFTIYVESKHAAEAAVSSAQLGGCPPAPIEVPAGGSRTINLDHPAFDRKDFGPTSTKVAVTFAIAGLAPSVTHTNLA